jgi:hypothetical protein
VRKLFFTSAGDSDFWRLLNVQERAIAMERLLAMAEDPDLAGALAAVGGDTNLRRAKILGRTFFLLPTERTANLKGPLLVVMKVRER